MFRETRKGTNGFTKLCFAFVRTNRILQRNATLLKVALLENTVLLYSLKLIILIKIIDTSGLPPFTFFLVE